MYRNALIINKFFLGKLPITVPNDVFLHYSQVIKNFSGNFPFLPFIIVIFNVYCHTKTSWGNEELNTFSEQGNDPLRLHDSDHPNGLLHALF